MSPVASAGGLERFAAEVRHVDKPWGYELVYALTDSYCGKLLFVRAGEALSLQYHRVKDETLYLGYGVAELEIRTRTSPPTREVMRVGTAFRIPPGTVHRLHAIRDSLFFEVSTPHLDDVVRIEDAYGRAAEAPPAGG